MNKEEIEYCGLKIVVNNETYTEYKGTLEEQIEILQQENQQLKDNWNKLKEYCQDNSFMQNTREYGTLTVVDADELAIYIYGRTRNRRLC